MTKTFFFLQNQRPKVLSNALFFFQNMTGMKYEACQIFGLILNTSN